MKNIAKNLAMITNQPFKEATLTSVPAVEKKLIWPKIRRPEDETITKEAITASGKELFSAVRMP